MYISVCVERTHAATEDKSVSDTHWQGHTRSSITLKHRRQQLSVVLIKHTQKHNTEYSKQGHSAQVKLFRADLRSAAALRFCSKLSVSTDGLITNQFTGTHTLTQREVTVILNGRTYAHTQTLNTQLFAHTHTHVGAPCTYHYGNIP